MKTANLKRWAFGLALATLTLAARADVTIEITGVGARQMPISIVNFAGEEGLKESVSAIVRADLERSGRFKLVDPGAAALPETAALNLGDWKGRGADSVAVASVGDGGNTVRLRLYDAVGQKQLAGWEVRNRGGLRATAHQLADHIYEALTGERGVFSTRIAYVVKQGKRYELQVADADGANAQTPLASPEPIMSPTWAPDGQRLAYVSFEKKKPIVYVQNINTGSRRAVGAFKGSNSAPAWSPDGRTLALTLTLDGISQLYLMDANGGEPRRLVRSNAIDTEPAFSPDGQWVAFTSDRGGSPQIYRVGVGGGEPQRLTFDGSYNVSPRFSPDGRTLAYIRRDGGRFGVAVLDLENRQSMVLTDSGYDESPTFAPNGKTILYATEIGRRGVLATVSVDGRIKQRLSSAGNVREPTWGPFSSAAAASPLPAR